MDSFSYGQRIVMRLKNHDIYYSDYVKYIEEESAFVVKNVTDLQGNVSEGLKIFNKSELSQINITYPSDDEELMVNNKQANTTCDISDKSFEVKPLKTVEKVMFDEKIMLEMKSGETYWGVLYQKRDSIFDMYNVINSKGEYLDGVQTFDCSNVRNVYCFENEYELCSCPNFDTQSDIEPEYSLNNSSASSEVNEIKTNIDAIQINTEPVAKQKQSYLSLDYANGNVKIKTEEDRVIKQDNNSQHRCVFGNYNYGQRLALEFKCKQVFYGDFVRMSKNRIDLKNIVDSRGLGVGGVKAFYACDLQQVYTFYTDLNSSLPFKIVSENENEIMISLQEYERLLDMTRNFVFIHQKNVQYYKACEDLTKQEFVGLVGIGSEIGRDGKLSILILTTFQNIYIFDCIDQRELSKEITFILETNQIQKIVFDGRKLINCIFSYYNINLTNIFDIQLAELSFFTLKFSQYQAQWRNIAQCLKYNLNFPSLLLYDALYTDKSWLERPLKYEIKFKAAQLSAYLIILKNYFESSVMLCNYNKSVSKYYESLINVDDSEIDKALTKSVDKIALYVSNVEEDEVNILPPDLDVFNEKEQQHVTKAVKKVKKKIKKKSPRKVS